MKRTRSGHVNIVQKFLSQKIQKLLFALRNVKINIMSIKAEKNKKMFKGFVL